MSFFQVQTPETNKIGMRLTFIFDIYVKSKGVKSIFVKVVGIWRKKQNKPTQEPNIKTKPGFHIFSQFYNKQKWLSMSLMARLEASFVKYCPTTSFTSSFSQKTLVELSPEVRCGRTHFRETKSNLESQGAHDTCGDAQTSIAFPTSP